MSRVDHRFIVIQTKYLSINQTFWELVISSLVMGIGWKNQKRLIGYLAFRLIINYNWILILFCKTVKYFLICTQFISHSVQSNRNSTAKCFNRVCILNQVNDTCTCISRLKSLVWHTCMKCFSKAGLPLSRIHRWMSHDKV